MNGIWETLKTKWAGLPIGVWVGLGTVALAIYLTKKKAKSASTQAAADQTNSDLGSAAQLANMFEVAGLMPYQGGDVYINTTETNNPPPSSGTPSGPGNPPPSNGGGSTGGHKPPGKPPVKGAPKPSATYTVKHGDTLTAIAHKYGTTWQALFKYNTTPGVRPADTEATLKKRGPNLLYAGEKILIPPKGYK